MQTMLTLEFSNWIYEKRFLKMDFAKTIFFKIVCYVFKILVCANRFFELLDVLKKKHDFVFKHDLQNKFNV